VSKIQASRPSTHDETAAEMDRRGIVIEEMETVVVELRRALQMFIRQWNACGPNSDFGRHFSNVRDAAVSALKRSTSDYLHSDEE